VADLVKRKIAGREVHLPGRMTARVDRKHLRIRARTTDSES
jgi:hypothetical protein